MTKLRCVTLSLLLSLGLCLASSAYAADRAGGSIWPVGEGPPPRIVRAWSPPATPYGPGHRGVDLAAPIDAPVRAVAAGRISFAGEVAGRGVVSLELAHTGDPPLRTTYEPVTPTLKEGAHVAPGEVIATLQLPTGHCPPSTPSCLHWGLRRAETYLNPLSLLDASRLSGSGVRLLPVWGWAPTTTPGLPGGRALVKPGAARRTPLVPDDTGPGHG
ncbi:M23 family metallopeptidase [Streptomyces sp. NPDC016845]|uniref:M23 family metallopeptidase n=1 Tax=Streptomyces sp. NPDC016845 TaxID=3364972 RepID=UPI003790DE94